MPPNTLQCEREEARRTENLERSKPAALDELVAVVIDSISDLLCALSHDLSQFRLLIQQGNDEPEVVDAEDQAQVHIAKRLLPETQVCLELPPDETHIASTLCRQFKIFKRS
jgi:hypothetical protein